MRCGAAVFLPPPAARKKTIVQKESVFFIMGKIRVMIVGYGNVGRGVKFALEQSPDMELAGVVSRDPARVRKEIDCPVLPVGEPEKWLAELHPDAAILCGGSKSDLPQQGPALVKYVTTVDSFDNHSCIPDYFRAMDKAAKESGHLAVISTGWDPGIFSLQRVLASSFMPGARAYGFYGLGEKGGLSMGHSDALRTIEGVADARQYTHAIPEAVEKVRRGENPVFQPGDMHTRECFVVLKPGADKSKIEETIRSMPGYFAPYRTEINFVSQEELNEKYAGFPHDGCVVAASTTGEARHGAVTEYHCRWGSNPEATANVLVAHARAAFRMRSEGRTGAYTILDIPASYFSTADRGELLAHFM